MKYNLEEDNLIEICKKSSYKELSRFCKDIREFLIEKVSKTGGHLASNLGIVELSVAIMRVFDSPRDKIIYDVGHQSYVHKILTGRASQFDTLRQYKGMSGFPKARESEHDAYDTGHSSTSISAASGMAIARDLSSDNYNVVAVIGDGSMTGGIVYEALNNIGARQLDVNIILNDNGMSIAKNVGAMSKYLAKLRTSKTYTDAKTSVKTALDNLPVIGPPIKTQIRTSRNKIKYSIMSDEGHIVEDLGIKYFGPVDGHNIHDLTVVLNAAKQYKGPSLIHVMTVKGKGYNLAEKYPRKFHGIGSFDINTGETKNKSDSKSFSEVFGQTITSLALNNDKILSVVAAMGTATGLTPFYEKLPKRYFDVGIAEEHAVVFSAGLAKSGYIPVVAIYSSFLQRAYDYIIEDVALQNLHVIFAIDRAGLVGADGETHHGVFDLSYLNMIPSITVLTPADGNQLSEMLAFAIDMDGPVAIRYPRGSSEKSHLRIKEFKGTNTVLSNGSDVTILSVGTMLDDCIFASEILKKKGYSVGITNISVVKPISDEWEELDTKLIVTVEDNVLNGGFGSCFNNKYNNKSFDIMNIGIPDKFVEHGNVEDLKKECAIDGFSIAERIEKYFEKKA